MKKVLICIPHLKTYSLVFSGARDVVDAIITGLCYIGYKQIAGVGAYTHSGQGLRFSLVCLLNWYLV